MGTDPTLPDDFNVVNFSAADIRWTLGEPPPPLERVDLLTLDDHELRTYCRDLQQEATWLRRLLHEALTHLQILTRQADRYRVRIDRLLAQLKTRRPRHGEAA